MYCLTIAHKMCPVIASLGADLVNVDSVAIIIEHSISVMTTVSDRKNQCLGFFFFGESADHDCVLGPGKLTLSAA